MQILISLLVFSYILTKKIFLKNFKNNSQQITVIKNGFQVFMMNFSTFGTPFQTTLPPMHQFTKFSEPMLLNGGVSNAVMVTTVQADTLQYMPMSHEPSSPPRLTTLTSSVQVKLLF